MDFYLGLAERNPKPLRLKPKDNRRKVPIIVPLSSYFPFVKWDAFSGRTPQETLKTRNRAQRNPKPVSEAKDNRNEVPSKWNTFSVPSLCHCHAGFGASSPALSAAPSACTALPSRSKSKNSRGKNVKNLGTHLKISRKKWPSGPETC